VNTNDDPEIELSLMQDLIMRSVDALIIAPCSTVPQLQVILDETPIPVVFTDRIGDEFGDFMRVDNAEEAGKLIDCFSVKPGRVGIIYPLHTR
jgi:DNA-binding LacI/PurR family transcriptional regulator